MYLFITKHGSTLDSKDKVWEVTKTRAPLVTRSAGADIPDRSIQARSLYTHACAHIHWLKLHANARGYCQTPHRDNIPLMKQTKTKNKYLIFI